MLSKSVVEKHIVPLKPLPTDIEPDGKPLTGIKGILFDIYGTLFISGSGDISIAREQHPHNQELNALLKKYNISQSPVQLKERLFSAIEQKHAELRKQGIDYPEIEIDLLWMPLLDSTDINFIRSFSTEYELIVNPPYPMPHLRETLTALTDNHLILGIISNAQFFTQELFFWFLNAYPQELGFDPDLIVYSYQYQTAKPSQILFQHAASILAKRNILPSEMIYIGNDMLNDIYPATQTGFQTALFAGDRRSLRLRKADPRCKGLTPDLIVTDLRQLTDYIVFDRF